MRISPIIEKILEMLHEGSEKTTALFEAVKSWQAREGSWPKSYRESQRFYSLLYHLKKQGLIENKKEGRGSVWRLKPAGVEKLRELKKRKVFSAAHITYREEPDTLKIVAFDIPVEENRKRFWLLAVLKRLGFKMLQKSVWFGKKKIPEAFMRDLREREMVDYVQIFSISKTGSLRELK